MPVKTSTIDMDAYDLLAAEKREAESFSRVIKRRFRKAGTSADLLANLAGICLSESGVRGVEKVLAARADSLTDSPNL